jgi:hypothetical protein
MVEFSGDSSGTVVISSIKLGARHQAANPYDKDACNHFGKSGHPVILQMICK